MADMTSNDNYSGSGGGGTQGPDAHGQAALLLVESLLHGLIARSVLSTEDGVDIIKIAAEVKVEVADDFGDSPSNLRRSLTLLTAIEASLDNDLPKPVAAGPDNLKPVD